MRLTRKLPYGNFDSVKSEEETEEVDVRNAITERADLYEDDPSGLKSKFQQAKAAVAAQRTRSRTLSEFGRRSSEYQSVSKIRYRWNRLEHYKENWLPNFTAAVQWFPWAAKVEIEQFIGNLTAGRRSEMMRGGPAAFTRRKAKRSKPRNRPCTNKAEEN
jgi:Mg-chelatase subunit ChlI